MQITRINYVRVISLISEIGIKKKISRSTAILFPPVGGIKESINLPVNCHPKGGLWITPDKSGNWAKRRRLIHRGSIETRTVAEGDPSILAGTIGVASSDGDSIALPWVMQTTSLPLSGLHYPGLFKWPPFGRLCHQLFTSAFSRTSLYYYIILPTGW